MQVLGTLRSFGLKLMELGYNKEQEQERTGDDDDDGEKNNKRIEEADSTMEIEM